MDTKSKHAVPLGKADNFVRILDTYKVVQGTSCIGFMPPFTLIMAHHFIVEGIILQPNAPRDGDDIQVWKSVAPEQSSLLVKESRQSVLGPVHAASS
jgi:hypothetical protein